MNCKACPSGQKSAATSGSSSCGNCNANQVATHPGYAVVNVSEAGRRYSSGTAQLGSALYAGDAWVPETAAGQWLELDLGVTISVAGVVTQGRHVGGGFERVTEFTVDYMNGGYFVTREKRRDCPAGTHMIDSVQECGRAYNSNIP